MKNEEKEITIEDIGEFGLIERLTNKIKNNQPTTILGPGDDAAIIQTKENTVISTDLLIEGVHFDMTFTPLKHLGYKSVVVNISDIYAMNAIPQQITVGLAFSNKYTLEAIDELYDGLYSSPNPTGFVNVFKVADELRKKRTECVRSFKQYQFLHKFLLDYVKKKQLYSDIYHINLQPTSSHSQQSSRTPPPQQSHAITHKEMI